MYAWVNLMSLKNQYQNTHVLTILYKRYRLQSLVLARCATGYHNRY